MVGNRDDHQHQSRRLFGRGTCREQRGRGQRDRALGIARRDRLGRLRGATHPTGGKAGDLYVDKTARLWFCKAGGATATWVA